MLISYARHQFPPVVIQYAIWLGLIASALFVVLCVGWQELQGIARGLLAVDITGAVGLLLPSIREPSDNSSDA